MDSQQPEALRIAGRLEISLHPIDRLAAAELRRLHEENERLKAREWQGLTDEEEILLIENESIGRGGLIEAVEANLKEKNA